MAAALRAAAQCPIGGSLGRERGGRSDPGFLSFGSSSVAGAGVRSSNAKGDDDGRRRRRGARCPASVSSVLADVPNDLMKFQEPIFPKPVADPKTVASIILGGGAGTRLFPLTMRRAEPAVPIGGGYRLIDVPMSNCINSGINKIYILTQFNSQSLNRHIARTYNSASGVDFGDGFVEVLAAMQTSGEAGLKWFQGTADAVRQFIWLFEDAKLSHIENILILSGDHLYRMDYMDFVQKHLDSGADISVSCIPMDESRASDFGLMKIDESGHVDKFLEKPKGESLKSMQVDTSVLGLSPQEALKFPYIASMGIYLFRTEVLLKLLRWSYPNANDFGSEIIPMAAEEHDVQAFLFNGYWEDIGTIKSFFNANLALAEQSPKFEFYDNSKPIYTSPRFLPPTKYENCQVSNSIISHGCFLRECRIDHSIVGVRSRLDYGVEIKIGCQAQVEVLVLVLDGSLLFAEGTACENHQTNRNILTWVTKQSQSLDSPDKPLSPIGCFPRIFSQKRTTKPTFLAALIAERRSPRKRFHYPACQQPT